MLLKNLLKPDYNKKGIVFNHMTSKLLIPLGIGTFYVNNNCDNKKIVSVSNQLFLSTVGIHSYISTSNIITDYIKPSLINKTFRIANLGLHTIAILGYSYYFIKKLNN